MEELSRSDAQRQLQKANSEMTAMQQRLEGSLAGAAQQELDDLKRKLNARVQEVTAQLEAAQGKATGADKARKRLQAEVEELTAELDKVTAGNCRNVSSRIDMHTHFMTP